MNTLPVKDFPQILVSSLDSQAPPGYVFPGRNMLELTSSFKMSNALVLTFLISGEEF